MMQKDFSIDESFMNRAIQLALKGNPYTAPNPMVGAVLVYKGSIIGEGFHKMYGSAHAEVNCINSVSEQNRRYIPLATMYVTLEPCCHYGKTPPCANLILQHNIKTVVVGMQDPNPIVSGNGIDFLRENGVAVSVGVLENECKNINQHFIVNQVKKRPCITLKWAQTEDGYIGSGNEDRWMISNALTQRLVHRYRAAHQAIAVGKHTALLDKPKLDTRLFPFTNPKKIVFYNNPSDINSLEKNYKVDEGWLLLRIYDGMDFIIFFKELLDYNIHSILIEGGKKVLDFFIQNNYWDSAIIITSNGIHYPITKDAIPAPKLQGMKTERIMLRNDTIDFYTNENSY